MAKREIMTSDKTIPASSAFRAIIERGKDAVTLIKADGTIAYRSPSYASVFSFDPADMQDKPLFELVHPEDLVQVQDVFHKIMNSAEGSFDHRWRQRKQDGSYIWIEGTSTNLLSDPDVQAIICHWRNVTEQMDTKLELEQRNEDLKRLFNTVDEVIYSIDVHTYQLTQMSEACIKVYGYPASAFFANNQLWREVILPEDLHVPDEIGRCLDRGVQGSGQYRIRHRDGSIRWIEADLIPTLDEKGKLIRMDGVNRDITEKKKAEQTLAESEKRFRTLIENSKDVIALTDGDKKITYVSPAIKDILGYEPEELLGRTSYDTIMSPVEKDTNLAFRESLAPGQTMSRMTKARHKNGSWRWLEAEVTNHLDNPAVRGILTNFRDVTEKKGAQEALRDSEKKYKALIENNKDGIILADSNAEFTYLSPSVTAILGYAPEELLGTRTIDLYHPDDLAGMEKRVSPFVLNREHYISGLTRMRHKDGQWRWIELTSSNRLEDPAINAIVLNIRDVTEKKNAEEALLNSEKKFRTLIENSKDVIALTDVNRRILYISPAIKSILGYAPEELQGMDSFQLMHTDESRDTMTIRAALAPGQSVSRTLRAQHKDGSWRWLESTLSNLLNEPGINAMVTNIRDVTEKKKAEQGLIDSERKFRALIENGKDGIALTGPDRLFTYIGPQVKSMMGYEPEELLGTHPLAMYHADDHQRIFTFVESIRDKNIPHTIEDLRIICKDGSLKWVDLTFCDQFDDPAVNALVCNFRDVTDRKKAEDALELLNQSLEKKIEERTVQLQESNKALESFSYMAAHDLQAPLRVLSGYAAILNKEYRSNLNEDGSKLLDTIILKTKHMSKLISDMLTFSRASHVVMTKANVSFDETVRDIADQLLLTATNSSAIKLTIHDLGFCSCDANLIRQAWVNLLSNAFKYSGKKENPEIEIGRTKTKSETVYYIKDNGAGFDMKYAGNLFEVFKRMHSTSDFEGTGIGLALVKSVIIRHGGRVWAEAEPDKGATFYFTMPNI